MKIEIVGSKATILSHHLNWKEKANHNLYQILCVTKECKRDTGSENTVLRTVLKIIIKMKKMQFCVQRRRKKSERNRIQRIYCLYNDLNAIAHVHRDILKTFDSVSNQYIQFVL